MKKAYHWAEGSGIRLAFIIALTTTALLLMVNVIISLREESSFVAAVQTIPTITSSGSPYRALNPNDYIPGQPYRLENLKTPRETFATRLHTDLAWVTVIGIIISVLLGLLLGQKFITNPLQKLQSAIGRLKERDFDAKVEPTGLPEFDYVVDEFNELAHELARAESLRQDVISDTSHELKTPLTSLRAQLEGMRDGVIPADKKRFTMLLTHVERLNDLTERLQEYTRLRNRTAEMNIKAIPLTAFVEDLLKEVQPELDKQKIEVTVEIPAGSQIQADQRLLEELFHNLLNNTLAYAEASRVTIALRKNNLYIADNGKGVPEEVLPNLFERFFRVEQSRSRSTGGLGLGLAIVKEIAEAHGWQISVENLQPHGLVFTLKLSESALIWETKED